MAYYKMNYRLCTIPFPSGGKGVLRRQVGVTGVSTQYWRLPHKGTIDAS